MLQMCQATRRAVVATWRQDHLESSCFSGTIEEGRCDFCSIDLRVGSLAGNQLSLKAGAETQSMTYDFCEKVAMIRDFYRFLWINNDKYIILIITNNLLKDYWSLQ